MNKQPSKTRRTRASVPHVKTGCFTCKYRRVKCDEGRPTCRRCQTFGVHCDGYSYPAHLVVPKGHKHPVSLRPRPSDAPSTALQISVFENSVEKNCFDFWRWKRLNKAHSVLDSSTWMKLIFESSHIASIRYCIISLGALELSRDHTHAARALLPSPTTPTEENNNVHHRTAIKYFDRAVRQMRADTISKSQSLRTTLMTCLLIHWFESVNGNYAPAVAQIRAGDELVSEWRALNSTTRTVVEDELVQAIGNLTLQTFSVPDRRPEPRIAALKQKNWEMLRSMPTEFTSMIQARQYLDILMKSAMYVSSDFFPLTVGKSDLDQTPMARPGSTSHPHFQTKNIINSNDGVKRKIESPTGSMQGNIQNIFTEPHARVIFEKPSIASLHTEVEREVLLAKHRQWNQAYRNMSPNLKDEDSLYALLIPIHRKACIHGINSLFLDPQSCDQEKAILLEIVELCTHFLDEEYSLAGGNTTFIPDLGVVFPLYFYGIGCRFPAIRTRIIDLLLRHSRREGVWDSIIAGNVVAWVRDLEERFLEGEGEDRMVPSWARVENIVTDGDLQTRTAKVSCWQRERPDDLIKIRREAFLSW